MVNREYSVLVEFLLSNSRAVACLLAFFVCVGQTGSFDHRIVSLFIVFAKVSWFPAPGARFSWEFVFVCFYLCFVQGFRAYLFGFFVFLFFSPGFLVPCSPQVILQKTNCSARPSLNQKRRRIGLQEGPLVAQSRKKRNSTR